MKNFKKSLNCDENLKEAFELVKQYNICKNVPFYKKIHKKYTEKKSSDGKLGHVYYLKLNKKNNLTIYKQTIYDTKVFVNIKLKTLIKLNKKITNL